MLPMCSVVAISPTSKICAIRSRIIFIMLTKRLIVLSPHFLLALLLAVE